MPTTEPTIDLVAFRKERDAERASTPPTIRVADDVIVELPSRLAVRFIGLGARLAAGDLTAWDEAAATLFGEEWLTGPLGTLDFTELRFVLEGALGFYMTNAGNS